MRKPGVTQEKGIIAWFAANSVAANLLMILIIVGGLITVGTIRKGDEPGAGAQYDRGARALPGSGAAGG